MMSQIATAHERRTRMLKDQNSGTLLEFGLVKPHRPFRTAKGASIQAKRNERGMPVAGFPPFTRGEMSARTKGARRHARFPSPLDGRGLG